MNFSVLKKKMMNLLLFAADRFVLPIITLRKKQFIPKTLLVMRLDSIGDYVLFRNFFPVIKRSERFTGYRITLLGNELWRDLAVKLDGDIVDDFLWLNRKKFYGSLFYRYRFLNRIHKSGFEAVLETLFTREILFGDTIANSSGAKLKIGHESAPEQHAKWKQRMLSNSCYTELIPAADENVFEFIRNAVFIGLVCKSNTSGIELEMPNKILTAPSGLPADYIVFVPGAQHPLRQWAPENFIKVAKYILENSDHNIVVCGTEAEKPTARQIVSAVSSKKIIDTSGSIDLVEYAAVLSGAKFVVANETSAVHFSAAMKIPVICVSNGNHYGRFHPYPEKVFSNAFYVYHKNIEAQIAGKENVMENERFISNYNINEIEPHRVITVVKQLMNA